MTILFEAGEAAGNWVNGRYGVARVILTGVVAAAVAGLAPHPFGTFAAAALLAQILASYRPVTAEARTLQLGLFFAQCAPPALWAFGLFQMQDPVHQILLRVGLALWFGLVSILYLALVKGGLRAPTDRPALS